VHFWCGINSHDIFVRTFIPTKISNADKQKIEANSKQRCREALENQVSKIAALLENLREICSTNTDPVCVEVR
jgi:hypothetical protein